MADLFISYSRHDQEFVRHLHAALTERGKEAWVDWEDIPPTAKWWEEIRSAVSSADAFAFVISPDSLSSKICGDELGFALEQNKRIVPLLRREPDGLAVPEDLASHNWIFFSDDEAFEQSLATLVAALETDVERTHLHTRLLVRGGEWDECGRDSSRLLRGSDLREAEEFVAQAEAVPEPTPLQREYVLASRRSAGRRQRALLAGVSVALVIAIVLGVFALIQRNTAQARERQAVSRALAALAVSKLGVDPELGVLLATEAIGRDRTPEADLALRRTVGADQLRATVRHGGAVRGVDFSPDGRLTVTASDDRTARISDARSGRQLHVLGHGDAVNFAVFSRDGSQVVTASADATARVWQTSTGRAMSPPLRAPGGLVKALPTPDGKLVAGAGADGALRLWEIATGKSVATLGDPAGPVISDFALSADGRHAVTGDGDGGARIWDLATGHASTLRGHARGKTINRVTFSPDGQSAATASDDGTARLWTLRGHPLAVLVGDHTRNVLGFDFVDGIQDVSFSADGRYIATAGLVRGTARIWSATTGRLVATLPGRASVYNVRFSPDSRLVLTAGIDTTARIWDAHTGKPLTDLVGHSGNVNAVAFTGDSRMIATASNDGTARVWETESGRRIAEINGQQSLMAAVEYPDGRRLLTAGGDGNASLWDPFTGKRILQAPQGHPIADAQISADGRWVLLSLGDALKVLDAATLGRRRTISLQSPAGHPSYTPSLSISRDGTRALCGTTDGGAVLWSTLTGRPLVFIRPPPSAPAKAPGQQPEAVVSSELSGDGQRVVVVRGDAASVYDASGRALTVLRPGAAIASAVFSPDGRRIATSGTNPPNDTGPSMWDASTGRRLLRLHDNFGVFNAAFSHDGRRLVTAGIAGTVTIWDVLSGRSTRVQGGPVGAADHADFSPDDRSIVIAGADGTTRIFDVHSGLGVATLGGPVEPVLLAQFSSSAGPVMTVDVPGHIRTYACDVCGSTGDVERAARSIVTRRLTAAERAQYLKSG